MVLNDGDNAVVIGEEGDGKSILMKWIYPLPDEGLYRLYRRADYFGRTAGLSAAGIQVEKEFFYREQRMGRLSGGEKIKAQLMLFPAVGGCNPPDAEEIPGGIYQYLA